MTENPRDICRRIRKTPLVITSIFLEILRAEFGINVPEKELPSGLVSGVGTILSSNPSDKICSNNIEDSFYWDIDPDKTELIIIPSFSESFENIQKRPAIIVKRNGINYEKVAIDDQAEKYEDTIKFMVKANGSVTCVCVCKTAAQVELLAEKVSNLLIAFKKCIREDFNFIAFEVMNLGEVGILKEAKESFSIPITTSIIFEEKWTLKVKELPIHTVRTNIILNSE